MKSGSVLRMTREWRRVLSRVRERQFDLSIDYHGVFKSGIQGFLARIPLRYGYRRGGSKEGNHWLTNRQLHLGHRRISRYQRALALSQFVVATEFDPHMPEIELTTEEQMRVNPILEVRPLILFPGTSHHGRNKRWPASYWAQVYRRFSELGAQFSFGPQDHELRVDIEACLGNEIRCLPPLSLVELSHVLKHAKGLVSCDTGPMHLASVYGTPIVALMGPSDPVLNAPMQSQGMLLPSVPCAPCRRRDCQLLICQNTTTPYQVIRKTEEMLAGFQ